MHARLGDIDDLLRFAAATDRKRDEEQRANVCILPEAAIARLQELLPAYTADLVRFACGDLVTPRRDATTKGAGEPHLVVAVLAGDDRHHRFDQGEAGSNTWGQLIDMRVLRIDGDRAVAYWVESCQFEPYAEASRG